MLDIRPPAIAGQFYPGDPDQLAQSVENFLSSRTTDDASAQPKALIVPHAGYIYSGACAGQAYRTLKPFADQIKHVVLLGPCHRVAVQGIAATTAQYWETPLGQVPINRQALETSLNLPHVHENDQAHEFEHSLEIHLPFLQQILPEFTLSPFAVGAASNQQVAELLDKLWGGPETLIVISTDLSHFLTYDQASKLDGSTAHAIENLDWQSIGRDQACGRIPMSGLLTTARLRQMKISRTGLCNSGDTAGDKNRVVGYGSWILTEPSKKDEKAGLLDRHLDRLQDCVARSILNGLAKGHPPEVAIPTFAKELQNTGATFVTLERKGQLRGCIGTIEPHQPLIQDLVRNAFSAAFKDHRFPPVAKTDLEDLTFAISILSPMREITFRDEEDLLGQLVPGETGLLISDKGRRSVFLPQVWDSLPDPKDFLAKLKLKAGMPADHWSTTFQAWIYEVEKSKPVRISNYLPAANPG